jgi:hypothetical protein
VASRRSPDENSALSECDWIWEEAYLFSFSPVLFFLSLVGEARRQQIAGE